MTHSLTRTIRSVALAAAILSPTVGARAQTETHVIGTFVDMTSVPNVAGARCGNHYELQLVAADGQKLTLALYDPKVHSSALKPLIGKLVDVTTTGGTVVEAIAPTDGKTPQKPVLAGLSTKRAC